MRDCASQQIFGANVRFGSKADIAAHSCDVRFTPKSGHRSRRYSFAMSGASRLPRAITAPMLAAGIGALVRDGDEAITSGVLVHEAFLVMVCVRDALAEQCGALA